MWDIALDRIATHGGRATASDLQRALGIGYVRASRIIEQMEADGVVGPYLEHMQCRLLVVRPDDKRNWRKEPDWDLPVVERSTSDHSVFLVPDLHSPLIDERAVSITLEVLDYFAWDKVILMGDVVNLDQLARYDKNPELQAQLQKDTYRSIALLRQIGRAAGKAEKIYLFGNHEGRLRKYLWRNAPPLATLDNLCIERELKLRELGYELQPEGEGYWITPEYLVTHGAKDDGCKYSQHSGYSAKLTYEKKQVRGAMAHTHRTSKYRKTTVGGFGGFMEVGCLIAFKLAGYVTNPNWQLACAGVDVCDTIAYDQLYEIINYRCMVRGKLFRA